MRYQLNMDRIINQMVPYYLSGRRYILFLQSLLYPLQSLNNSFVKFAKEKQIEAGMTSQSIYFEWFLNYKFRQFLRDKNDTIYIKDSEALGVDLYHEISAYSKPYTVWHENEPVITSNNAEKPREFYHLSEEKVINKVSFIVCVPAITIQEQEFVYMLSYVVNTYKLAGMTYLIKIDANEFEPNKKTNK